MQDFLEQVALWSEPEKAAAEEEQDGSPDVVNVMTLHLSKGLEFAVVFIVGKPIQCPCPLSSASNVLYAFYSSGVIVRLPEAVWARHAGYNQHILSCCIFAHLQHLLQNLCTLHNIQSAWYCTMHDPYVLFAGCEDALMPHGGLLDDVSDPRDLERHNEEVRLLYVGMTRAKEQLHLLHAKERAPRGGMQRFSAKISPFLRSIPGFKPYRQHSAFDRTDSLRHSSSQTYRQFSSKSSQPLAAAPVQPAQKAKGAIKTPLTPAQARAARRCR